MHMNLSQVTNEIDSLEDYVIWFTGIKPVASVHSVFILAGEL